MDEFLSKLVYYPLADWHFAKSEDPSGIRAEWTGEFRPPKKGEWYLSGALIEAYQARTNMADPYHIARIVRIEKIVSYRVKKVLPNTREDYER